VGIGVGLSGVAIEAAGTLVSAVTGQPIAGLKRDHAQTIATLGPPGTIESERLSSPIAERAPQPSQGASFRPDLRTRIGQMLLVGFNGTVVDGSSEVVRDIVDRGLGGVVLFDRVSGTTRVRNIESPTQVTNLITTLQSAAARSGSGAPLLVAVDQEGGSVARLKPRNGFPGTYSASVLGGMGDTAFTEAQGAEVARTLAAVGFNLNLAPVVDLNLNAANRIIGGSGRSFSSDAAVATEHAAAFIRGHRSAGVLTSIKHFPGQGSASADTHHGAVNVTANWTDVELQPFRALVDQGLADAVMTAHIFHAGLDPNHPATLSTAIVQGLLRDGMGYEGVVISDDLNMGAISEVYPFEQAVALAVGAGVDILTIGQASGGRVGRAIDVIEGLVTAGAIPEARIDASYDRIMALKARIGA
jgi:beta-N-acetylhexosaminidase